MSNFEMNWGSWIAEGFYLILLVLLLGVTAIEGKRAYTIEGNRLLVAAIIAVPWLVEITLGATHPFWERTHGHTWVDPAFEIAMLANPVMWIAALILMRRAWRCVLPFVVFNLFVAYPATIFGGCSLAGACL